jgi:hypothetical protein
MITSETSAAGMPACSRAAAMAQEGADRGALGGGDDDVGHGEFRCGEPLIIGYPPAAVVGFTGKTDCVGTL